MKVRQVHPGRVGGTGLSGNTDVLGVTLPQFTYLDREEETSPKTQSMNLETGTVVKTKVGSRLDRQGSHVSDSTLTHKFFFFF